MDHLEDVLSNKPIEVVSGHAIVEIKPQGVTKGRVVERILAESIGAADAGAAAAEFILCIGDDRSDEDMFNMIETMGHSPSRPAEVSLPNLGVSA